jgi:hypothetical protein
MAFELIGGWPEEDIREGIITAGTAIEKGRVLAISGNVLAEASASSDIHSIVGVSDEAVDTAATTIKYIPIVPFTQRWKFATTNATNANQRYENCILGANGGVVNNTGTTVSGPTGIVTLDNYIGATTDNICTGWFNRLGPTST